MLQEAYNNEWKLQAAKSDDDDDDAHGLGLGGEQAVEGKMLATMMAATGDRTTPMRNDVYEATVKNIYHLGFTSVLILAEVISNLLLLYVMHGPAWVDGWMNGWMDGAL